MNPEFFPAKLSMAMGAALIAALAGFIARFSKQAQWRDASYGLAALGLIAYFGASAMGGRFIDHAVAMWFYLAAAAIITGAYFFNRAAFPLWSTLTPMLATAYLFAPATIWRWPLTLPLFAFSIFSAVGFARGEEPPPMIDVHNPGRLPLRRPPRILSAREMACAVIAAALALVFGAALFWPAPPPVEAPAGQAETISPETADAPTESVETKESSVEEPASYTARAGDTFKSVARRLYGDAATARDIARVNPGIKSNAKLRAGQKIMLPSPAKRPVD